MSTTLSLVLGNTETDETQGEPSLVKPPLARVVLTISEMSTVVAVVAFNRQSFDVTGTTLPGIKKESTSNNCQNNTLSTSTSAPAGGLSWPTNCDCSDGGAGTTSTSAPEEGLSWPTNCDCSDGGAGTTSTTALADELSWPTSCECSDGGAGTTSTSAPAEGLSWPTNCDCSDSGAGTTLTTTLTEEPSWPTSFTGVDVSHMLCNTTKPDEHQQLSVGRIVLFCFYEWD